MSMRHVTVEQVVSIGNVTIVMKNYIALGQGEQKGKSDQLNQMKIENGKTTFQLATGGHGKLRPKLLFRYLDTNTYHE